MAPANIPTPPWIHHQEFVTYASALVAAVIAVPTAYLINWIWRSIPWK